MKKSTVVLLFIAMQLLPHQQTAQQKMDSISINFPLVIGNALNGNMPEALKIINASPDSLLIRRHLAVKKEMNDRFRYDTDVSSYDKNHHSGIDSLLQIFKSYWRRSFLGFPSSDDAGLKNDLTRFFKIQEATNQPDSVTTAAIDRRLKKYVAAKGYHTVGFSRTGKYYDLMVWKTERDTVFTTKLDGKKVNCPVIFMEDFVTKGWQEYATADKIHPGGWAGDKSLYCIRASYDLKSEKFLVSFLGHEARHFQDYKRFPWLSNPDLEYRAKLTELGMVETTMYPLISFFIPNANKDSKDGHQLGNYYVIRDLSRELFQKEFEGNIEEWKKLPISSIHKASEKLLRKNDAFHKSNKTGYAIQF